MMRIPLVVVVILLFAALAGCVSEETGNEQVGGQIVKDGKPSIVGKNGTLFDPEWALHAVPYGEGHNHSLRSDHVGLSTPNFEVLGYDPLRTDWHGRSPGGFGCSHAAEDGERRLTVTNSFNTDVGLIISDVTDPLNPQKIGELALPSTHVYDNSITPDLRYVLLATSPFESGPEDVTQMPLDAHPAQPVFRDACTGATSVLDGPEQGLPYAAGLILVDIENPRVPRIIDWRAFPPIGVHSIRAYDVDGETLLIASVFGLSGAGGYYMLMNILDTPDGGKLNVLSLVYPPSHYAEGPQRIQDWATHDAYIQKHPKTGQWLAYLADVYHGVWIVNIDDPSQPEFIGQWDAKPSFGRDILVHGVAPTPELWDDRHYTFVGEECFGHFEQTPTCVVATLDTTDPTKPKVIGSWTVPVDLQWELELQWSLHYAELVGKTLLVTNYHGGIWAVDVSTPQARREMPTIGVFIPDHEPPEPIVGGTNTQESSPYHTYTPIVWDFTVFDDGTIATYDFNSGLYMIEFDATNPAPAPEPWPMDHVKLDG